MSEPSMEDILASIRRIIAEDPPGSRPAAAPAQVAPAPSVRPEPAAPLRPMQRLSPSPFEALTRGEDRPQAEPELPRTSPADPFRREIPSFASAFPPVSSRAQMQEALQDEVSRFAAQGSEPHGSDQRIEPSFQQPFQRSIEATPDPVAAAPRPAHEPKMPERASEPFHTPKPADRIDAQLSELLGEAALPVGVREGFFPPSPAPSGMTSGSSAGTTSGSSAGAMGRLTEGPSFANLGRASTSAPSHSSSAASSPASSPAPRPGFTVSRVGFIAEDIPPAAPAATTVEDDPFEFNLGPSPFARAKLDDKRPAAEPAPVATSEAQGAGIASAPASNSASFASDIDALIAKVATSTAATVATPAADPDTAPVADALATPATDLAADGRAPEAAAPEAVEADALGDLTATQNPDPETPAASDAEIDAAAAEADEDAGTAVTAQPTAAAGAAPEIEKVRDILPLASAPSAPPGMAGLQALMRSQAQTEYLSAPPAAYTPPAYAPTSLETAGTVLPPSQRTAEEALAELLRPMLRSWLSENMPKIVERALRQELAGQISADQKTAAE